MQIIRNSQDAENKENKPDLMLENFSEFLFSLFHLLFRGIPPSCPGGTVLTAGPSPAAAPSTPGPAHPNLSPFAPLAFFV